MASSVYNPYVITSSMDGYERAVNLKTDFSDILTKVKGKSVPFVDYTGSQILPAVVELGKTIRSASNSSSFRGIMIGCSGSHSCRETLLSSTAFVLEEVSKQTLTGRPVIAVHYETENHGKPLSDEFVELLLQFDGTVFRGEYPAFGISHHSGKLWVACDYSGPQNIFDMSFLLYCMRLREPIELFLKEQETKLSDWPSFLRWVSKAFLSHENWGNSANDCTAMSAYAHMRVKHNNISFEGKTGRTHSGPNNLISAAFTTIGLIEWLEYIIALSYPRKHLPIVDNLGRNMQESIEKLYPMLYRKYDEYFKEKEAKRLEAETKIKAMQENDEEKSGAKVAQKVRKTISSKTMKKVLGDNS